MTTRRAFIKQSLAVSAGFAGLSQFVSMPALARETLMKPVIEKWLELPDGFTANVISKWGDKMSDGLFVPGHPDGMAAFEIKGKVVLVRNHENKPSPEKYGAYGQDLSLLSKVGKTNFFDYGFGKKPGLGGTSTIIYNEKNGKLESQFLSLTGTYRNCAGGPTPWNSWITCEEDTTQKGTDSETDHGYNFEVPASSKGLIQPIPIKGMGRFNHEAICVDPRTGIVYETEDRGDSLIYRFLPNEPGKLHKGGTLQALCIKAQKGFDTRNWEQALMKVSEPLEVEWITLTDVDADDDLRLRGHKQGAALFARGEGMWFGKSEVYFACTNGGSKKSGQVFKYIPSSKEGKAEEKDAPGKLVLFAEPNNTDILKYCDNLTVAPWGDVILVEDSKDAYIRGITPAGKIYTIGRNVGSDSEMAGACFSPSGKTLFVNIQGDGLTLAITGPWDKLRQS
jgi:secreted PhoX family phosphatase